MTVHREIGVGDTSTSSSTPTSAPATETIPVLPPGVWFKGEAVAAVAFGAAVVGAAVTYVLTRPKEKRAR